VVDWIPVESSWIVAAAYDEGLQTIFVAFPNGKKWWYSGCPIELWQEFVNASSKGRFMNEELKQHANGQYDG
jgi:hypothetical protein